MNEHSGGPLHGFLVPSNRRRHLPEVVAEYKGEYTVIRTVAELLSGITREVLPQLDAVEVKHAPTIGDMYEGLSAELLGRAIPEGIELDVVTGFAHDGSGNLSRQLDCMVVRGKGDPIPYTNAFVWHVKDVIAVIEVKKTLHSAQIVEALDLLRSVWELENRYRSVWATEAPNDTVDITSAQRAFSQTTGLIAPSYGGLEALSAEDQMIFHTLVSEQQSIVRIMLGYHGFKSELAFRKALVDILRANVGVRGFSPSSLPQLIISGSNSIVKMNGRPYSAPLIGGQWPFYVSTPVNPMLILLELVWTRLDQLFGLPHLWREDLDLEVPRTLILATGERYGWHLSFVDPSEDDLQSLPTTEAWSPAFVSLEEFVVLQRLCAGGTVKVDDPKLLEWLRAQKVAPEDLCRRLIATRLVAMHGKEMKLITIDCLCAVLPSGEYVAAENNTGRLSRWIDRRIGRDRTEPSGG
ncbi:DUF6602 domain-containing protein [Phytohabitans kaempferiae]|uniref:DUF6602 domain-containing protein n=1 Tax=Phytohabitans kaempferiae TaxID=1620943 RepID=A0ABV6M8K0_9ACTN